MAISVVQTKTTSGSSTSTTLTVTLAATTAGNCLVVCVGGISSSWYAVTGVTLGGLAGNFAKATGSNSSYDGEIWVDDNCAGGQTSLVVTWAGTTEAAAVVYEISGLATSGAVDQVHY